MDITIYTELIWITAILVGSLGLVIYLGSKKLSSRLFALSIFFVAIWTAVIGFFEGTKNYDIANFELRIALFIGTAISSLFLCFFYSFPSDIKLPKKLTLFLLAFQFAVGYLYFFTNLVDAGPLYLSQHFDATIWGWKNGPLYFVFELSFFGFFFYGLSFLYKRLRQSKDRIEKKNIGFIFLMIVIGLSTPALFSIVLPQFGIFSTNWLGPLSGIIWVPIIAYSIVRYRQMNVKVVVTEALAIAMALIFFINIFLDIQFGIAVRIVTFIAFLILAYYLIRISLREAEHKEQLAELNSSLEQKVAEQTIEIRKSYDLEKKVRRELEKLNETKDQFIMITQHHLRTPVTTIRWNVEEALKGTYGELQTPLKGALENTNTAINRLMRIVDDFLSITALKVGSQILNIAPTRILPLLEDVLAELHFDIKEKRINLSYPTEPTHWPELPIDGPKVRETILIVIENAIRYNIPGGSIHIETNTYDNVFEMTVENTGIGIAPEEREKLFTSLFYRGDDAKSAHPIGMGVGLSVSRAIIRAHHGELTINSEGKGKGAKATITLPITR